MAFSFEYASVIQGAGPYVQKKCYNVEDNKFKNGWQDDQQEDQPEGTNTKNQSWREQTKGNTFAKSA